MTARVLESPPLGRRLRGRRVFGERFGHRVSSAHLQAAYPFMAEGGLGGRGVYIGRDAYGSSLVFDPWELYGRELTSPNMVVVGQLGVAKSALVKTYLFRQRVFGRRAWVIDVKREYGHLADALGGTVIALRPGGDVRLNPLTRLAGAEGQLRLLRAVTIAALRRPLEPEEDGALREALRELREREEERDPTLPELVHLLLEPTAAMARRLVTSDGSLRVEARPPALALQRLCEGDLCGMFDGQTTPGLDFDAPLVVLDLHDLYDSEALAILMTCATAWMQAHVDAERERCEQGGEPPPKFIGVVDEAWRVFGEAGLGKWLQKRFKLARAAGQQNIIVMHRFSDLRAAGDEGSRQARLAEGLLADTDTRVVYRQAEDQVPLTVELLGLTETEAKLLPTLAPGQAIWRVGLRSFLVQHRLSSIERPLVDTDAAMSVERPAAAA